MQIVQRMLAQFGERHAFAYRHCQVTSGETGYLPGCSHVPSEKSSFRHGNLDVLSNLRPMPDHELTSHIIRLRSEASIDSSGRFTVDAERMLAVLARFQLAEPQQYVLLTLTSAVAAGATWFQIGRASCRERV